MLNTPTAAWQLDSRVKKPFLADSEIRSLLIIACLSVWNYLALSLLRFSRHRIISIIAVFTHRQPNQASHLIARKIRKRPSGRFSQAKAQESSVDREISVLLNTYFTFSNHVRDSNCCSALPFFSCTCSHTLAPCVPYSRWLMNVLDLSPHEFEERCGDHAKQSTVAASIHSTEAEARSQRKPRPTRKMRENWSLSRDVTRCHEMSRDVTRCHKMSQDVTRCHKMSQDVTRCHEMSRDVTTCHNMPQDVTTCHKMSQDVTRCHEMSQDVTRCHKMSRDVTRCHEMSQDVTRCHEMSWDVTRCHKMSRDVTRCHEMSQDVIRCHKMSQDVTRCHKMSRDVSRWHEMSRDVTRCHKMSQDVTKCHEMSQDVTRCHNMPQHAARCHKMS